MKKTFSKMLGVIISVVLLSDIATSSVFAFNQEAEMNKEVQVIAIIEVSDPITGEVSTFEDFPPLLDTKLKLELQIWLPIEM